MPKTIDEMIDAILEKEGGYVDHPADRGGPTNFGVTQRTLSAWLGRPASREDVRHLKVETARTIYRRGYFEAPRIDRLPPALQPQLFDMAVHHGPGGAIRMLQELLTEQGYPCAVDGGVGPQTASQAGKAWAELGQRLCHALCDKRARFCEGLCEADVSQKVFLAGWLNRVDSFRV